MSDNIAVRISRKRQLESPCCSYGSLSDSEIEEGRSPSKRMKLSGGKSDEVLTSLYTKSTQGTPQSPHYQWRESSMNSVLDNDNEADVPKANAQQLYRKRRAASDKLAKTLMRCLISTQNEVERLSPKEVRPSLNKLKLSLSNSQSAALELSGQHVATELTRSLKSELKSTLMIANKLCVPSSLHSESHKVASRGLRNVRRFLNMGMRMAETLHAQWKILSRTLPVETSSKCEPQKSSNSIPKGQVQPTNTTNPTTLWKPSLNTPFYLKPPTLVYQGMTPQLAQNLMKTLAASAGKKNCNKKKAQSCPPQGQSVEVFDKFCKDLKCVLKEAFTPSKGSPGNPGLPTTQKSMSGSQQPQSTHWKPSMKVPFFLKPPTLVFKGMTAQQVQNLTKKLTEPETVKEPNKSKKTLQDQSYTFQTACQELHDVLTNKGNGSQKLKHAADHPSVSIKLSKASKQGQSVINDIVDVGLVKMKKTAPAKAKTADGAHTGKLVVRFKIPQHRMKSGCSKHFKAMLSKTVTNSLKQIAIQEGKQHVLNIKRKQSSGQLSCSHSNKQHSAINTKYGNKPLCIHPVGLQTQVGEMMKDGLVKVIPQSHIATPVWQQGVRGNASGTAQAANDDGQPGPSGCNQSTIMTLLGPLPVRKHSNLKVQVTKSPQFISQADKCTVHNKVTVFNERNNAEHTPRIKLGKRSSTSARLPVRENILDII